MKENKENLFILNERYKNLLNQAISLIPENSVIIETLYKEVYEKDLTKCLNDHFGEPNDVEIYIMENYEGCLEIIFILTKEYDELFISNLHINIENILERYEDISLFDCRIESFNYRFKTSLDDLRGYKFYKMK